MRRVFRKINSWSAWVPLWQFLPISFLVLLAVSYSCSLCRPGPEATTKVAISPS
jgi:hypothetical protein